MSPTSSHTEQILSQLPGEVLTGLRRVDARWRSYCNGDIPIPQIVRSQDTPLETVDWDVAICGGTLGIILGCTLVQRGWSVVVIERGPLQGREQEWNISRHELSALVRVGALSEAELEHAIATEYHPGRLSFGESGKEHREVWVDGVLNIGVSPVVLLETLKQRFLDAGGHLADHTTVQEVAVHPNGVAIAAIQNDQTQKNYHSRLVLDVMGHFSPIALQARAGDRPDAACLVVGTCADGYDPNPTGDLFASFTPIQNQCQYFWEAFPAQDGRTTYLFTYLDLHPDRLSLEQLFDEYFRLLPDYQSIDLEQLAWKRALFGFFPCYRNSPLRSPWDRIVHIGDSSGSQSPLSFGGFGNLIRHIERLTTGLNTALDADELSRSALALLQPYQPNLSVTWLFQKSMSVRVNQAIAPNQINTLLAAVFQEMEQLGDPVLKPFLQDVVRFPGLFQTLTRTGLFHFGTVAQIVPQVGIPALADWTRHYLGLFAYTGLSIAGDRLAHSLQPWLKSRPASQRYYIECWLDAWRYGSGRDYNSPFSPDPQTIPHQVTTGD
jgi:lycopene cyclase CruP